MTITCESRILQHLRRAALCRDGAGLTDGQLLERFLEQNDQDAMAALVQRHGPMVWGVCRRTLTSHHDAEDAFQATFLVLVRKAASIVPRDMVPNWLYGVAYHTAVKARAMASKRRARERQVSDMPEPAALEEPWRPDWLPLLDQELSRLPDKYRRPIVLCDLEGKTYKEAARQMGCPEGTLAARLARARTMLARRLSRRGVTLSGGSLAVMLAQNGVSAAVPASLVSSTIKVTTHWASGQAGAGVISAKVAALTEGVLKTMLLSKLKIVTPILLLIGFLGAGFLGRGLTYEGPALASARAQQSAGPSIGKEEKSTDDKNLLRGTWKVVRAEAAGKHQPREVSDQQVVVIAADKLTIRYEDGETWEMGYKLFPAEKPKGIDLTPANGLNQAFTMKGSYELAGKGLKLCFTLNQLATERPKEFDVGGDRGRRLYILERQETPPKPAAPSKSDDFGAVKEVSQDGLILISLGGLKDVRQGDLLEAFRLKPRPEYLGQIKILQVKEQEAVGRVEKRVRPIQRGDQVARQILDKAQPQVDKDAAKELQDLQGVWLELGGEFRGKVGTEEEAKISRHKLVIKDGTFTWGTALHESGNQQGLMKGTIAIDPIQKPKALDLTFLRDGKTATGKCIYILEGNLLKLSYGEPERPTGFKTRADSNFPRIYLWQRQKPEGKGGAGKDGAQQGDAAKGPKKTEIATFSPDGTRVAVAKGDKAISIFHAQTGKEMIRMLGHTDTITALAFSPDGKMLASGAKDKAVCVWDTAAGRQLLRMQAPSAAQAIVFSGDGRNFIVHEADKTIREYDIATGKEIRATKEKEKK